MYTVIKNFLKSDQNVTKSENCKEKKLQKALFSKARIKMQLDRF